MSSILNLGMPYKKKLSHCHYSSDLWSIVTSVVVKSWIPKIMTFTLKLYTYNVTFLELLKCDFIMTVFLKHCSEVLVDVISVIIVT